MRLEATKLLNAARDGDTSAASRLMPLIYDELRRIARGYLNRGGPAELTLQPTALVHEAYVKLADETLTDLNGQTHFRALAARVMRQVLIDHLRSRGRARRGGDWQRCTIGGAADLAGEEPLEALALAEALEQLAELDERAAKVVELRFFGGLTEEEIGRALGVTSRTVRSDWNMARAWLRSKLTGIPPGMDAES